MDFLGDSLHAWGGFQDVPFVEFHVRWDYKIDDSVVWVKESSHRSLIPVSSATAFVNPTLLHPESDPSLGCLVL